MTSDKAIDRIYVVYGVQMSVTRKINGVIEDKTGETESKAWMNVMSPFFTSARF